METKTVKTETTPAGEDPVPIVTAKKRIDEPGGSSKEEQNAAEIARLATWATGECGKPILAD
jgi:hypothetical protein